MYSERGNYARLGKNPNLGKDESAGNMIIHSADEASAVFHVLDEALEKYGFLRIDRLGVCLAMWQAVASAFGTRHRHPCQAVQVRFLVECEEVVVEIQTSDCDQTGEPMVTKYQLLGEQCDLSQGHTNWMTFDPENKLIRFGRRRSQCESAGLSLYDPPRFFGTD